MRWNARAEGTGSQDPRRSSFGPAQMRSAAGWSIEEGSESTHFLPWLESEPDPRVRQLVWDWLARLGEMPYGRGVEERPGVFAARVPGTNIGVIWTLDLKNKLVILARLGSWQ